MRDGGVRVDSLDHLRGLLAATIMIYHYVAWSFPGYMAPDGVLSILGYYGVSAFFVISGISLAIAYQGRLSSFDDVATFFKRRFFRIAPLYWVAVTLSILAVTLTKGSLRYLESLSWFDIFANYSLSFSLFGPSKALATGGWSIGNEIFFYLCFPLLYAVISRSLYGVLLMLGVVATTFTYWAFVVVPEASTSGSEAWFYYTSNPNQILFFVIGVMIGGFSKPGLINKAWSYVGLLCAALILLAVSTDRRSDLVEEWLRVLLSGATLLLVFCVYQINWSSSNIAGRVLAFLGLISYSLYLLHPIVRMAVKGGADLLNLSPIAVVVTSVALTLVVSWLSYSYIELTGMRLGRSLERALSKPTPTTN